MSWLDAYGSCKFSMGVAYGTLVGGSGSLAVMLLDVPVALLFAACMVAGMVASAYAYVMNERWYRMALEAHDE